MKVVGIIPARLASTRFPNKPLVEIGGKTMIRRVYEQALKAEELDALYVATDSDAIADEVKSFGGNFIMTSASCKNGTERVNEALSKIETAYDIAINIQGDEPFFEPSSITSLLGCFQNDNCNIATLTKQISDKSEIDTPSVVKVVYNSANQAIYFSRSAIPFCRETMETSYFKHIGIYAYRSNILSELVKLNPTPLEMSEQLEQLRWLENGYNIHIGFTKHDSNSVDTPADLENIKKQFNIH